MSAGNPIKVHNDTWEENEGKRQSRDQNSKELL